MLVIKGGIWPKWSLAREFGVSELTVRALIIKEDQIRLNYSKLSKEESSNKKNISNLKFPELGIALFLWFNQGRELGAPVSGDMIHCKVS